jgi:hypothetical protein
MIKNPTTLELDRSLSNGKGDRNTSNNIVRSTS